MDLERESKAAENAKGDESEPMVYCPRCDERLASERCKLICRQCGYYMSCADYY